ncbi:MAG: ABC transporter substrate-binding protein [Chloroflexales bacterium]|nr:ABC transporter substrate-binding protein [Chloroflexales bacterium]
MAILRWLCCITSTMLRRYRLVGLVLASLLIIGGCGAAPAESDILDTTILFSDTTITELPQRQSYRIGINTEVTGNGAQIGDLSIRAARLAVEEINANGGVNGIPFELIVRDCRSDAVTALEQYRAAIAEDDLIALLGPLKSAYAITMAPEHRWYDLPMFIGATNYTLTDHNAPNLFRMRPSDRLTAAAMVSLAVEQLDAQQIGIIYDSDAFGSGGTERVVVELQQRGLLPRIRVSYPTGTKDFDTVVQTMAEANVDTVLIYGANSTDVGLLLRAIRYWNLDVTLITSPGGASAVTHNVAAEAQDGIYVAIDAVFDTSPIGAAFQQSFVSRFGLQPDTYIAWYYDSIYLLAETLQEHPDDPATLSAAIRATTYEGAQGRYRFDSKGEGLHTVKLVSMYNGQPQLIGAYSASGLVTRDDWQSHVKGQNP